MPLLYARNILSRLATSFRHLPYGGEQLQLHRLAEGKRPWAVSGGYILYATFALKCQATEALAMAGFQEIRPDIYKLRRQENPCNPNPVIHNRGH